MKIFLQFFVGMLFVFPLYSQQVPDFTMTDVYGVEHSLYADYLDQGKTVYISVATTWNPWDSVWVESGVLDEFQAQYGNDGVVMFIEGDTYTPESTLFGIPDPGSNGSTYNFVEGHDYIIMDDSLGVMIEEFGVNYFPYALIICPDGTGYSEDPGNPNIQYGEGVFYGDFTSGNDIADKMYELCGTDFDRSKLNGLVYFDDNMDCDETGELGAPQMIVSVDGPTGSFFRITDNAGEFRALADSGTYVVEVLPPNTLWDVCDNPQTAEFTNMIDTTFLDFGLQANVTCTQPTIDISAPALVRCFQTCIYVDYCNEGTIASENTEVMVALDSFLIVDSLSVPVTSQNGLLYTFDVGTLDVFECGQIVFWITTDCESELDTMQCFSASITDSECGNNDQAFSEECQPIVGSWDPNDKRAFPFQEGDDYEVGPNTNIKYQVRFQNTGSFLAFNVEVLDTISPHLDLSTFRMGNASHSYEVTITEDRTLRVLFEGINLPDSTSNELESHGFFTYYISQMPDLPEGTDIENSAAIYFDFNDPVITNTTVHTIDYNIVSIPEIDELPFTLSPNPAKTYVEVSLSDVSLISGNYKLRNLNGQLMKYNSFNEPRFTINTKDLPAGIYFLQIIDDEGNTGTQKILIQ